MSAPLIELRGITRTYGEGEAMVRALRGRAAVGVTSSSPSPDSDDPRATRATRSALIDRRRRSQRADPLPRR